jgi:hypothetical protein
VHRVDGELPAIGPDAPQPVHATVARLGRGDERPEVEALGGADGEVVDQRE